MIYADWLDAAKEGRTGKPRIAAFKLRYTVERGGYLGYQYRVRYMIIGTEYGYLRTSAGDVRHWKTRSGAAHWLRKNIV